MASTQCSRREWSMADVPSMTTKIQTVSTNHMPKSRKTITQPAKPFSLYETNELEMVMSHKTAESWLCASDSAQSRRYEAVCETQFRQNSIVWITWWIITSPNSKCSSGSSESSIKKKSSPRELSCD
ncbi:hypothetical protein OGATHE_002839 [Ogataea polymorpha]|uniref:Uncharacterized protein n=1 Tax=Ogataea polymorpha TaxID=460523 RepID=A0A9P8T9H2_9ASCO|nr:hypothetical protein OGATHE_002839 [Ogataea polymorpha]